MKDKELSILIYSCSRNSDMWEVFSKLFNKYWSDCPFKVVLVTDEYDFNNDKKKYVFDEVEVINSTWGTMMKTAINKVNTPYVMLFMDDYLLCDYVNNNDIYMQLEITKKYNAANLRLMESPIIHSEKFIKNSNLGCFDYGTAYSISTQVGIWDAQFLVENIVESWSAWDFEKRGSIEYKSMSQPLLSAFDYTFPYEEGVRKGKWMDNGVRLCKRNGIVLDYSKRKAMNSLELAKIYFFGAILEINPTLVMKIQNIFTFGFHNKRHKNHKTH